MLHWLRNQSTDFDWKQLTGSYMVCGLIRFKPNVAFYIKTSHLICSANQMTDFYEIKKNWAEMVKRVAMMILVKMISLEQRSLHLRYSE